MQGGGLLLGKNLEPSPAAGSHYLAGQVSARPITQGVGFSYGWTASEVLLPPCKRHSPTSGTHPPTTHSRQSLNIQYLWKT